MKKGEEKKHRKRKGEKAKEGENAGGQLDRSRDLKLAGIVAVAQAQTRVVAELQKLVATLLRRIIESLPPSAEELDPEVELEGAADALSELRRTLQCVLKDDVEPAYEHLLDGAEHQPLGGGYLLLDLLFDGMETSASTQGKKPGRRARS